MIEFNDEKLKPGMKGITFILDNGKTVVFDGDIKSDYFKETGIIASAFTTLKDDKLTLLKIIE